MTETIKIMESFYASCQRLDGVSVSEDEWKQNEIHIVQKH